MGNGEERGKYSTIVKIAQDCCPILKALPLQSSLYLGMSIAIQMSIQPG